MGAPPLNSYSRRRHFEELTQPANIKTRKLSLSDKRMRRMRRERLRRNILDALLAAALTAGVFYFTFR